METFIQAYFDIVNEGDEIVDRDELIQYCKEKDLDMDLVDQWMDKFDLDSDGKISAQEFCRVIGINLKEMMVNKVQREHEKSGNVPNLDPEIQVIGSKMPMEKIIDITERYKELLQHSEEDDLSELIKGMKAYLDKMYNPNWQVIVLRGSFWMNISHEPFQSLQFKHKRNVVVMWRIATD